jgi:micrococcal nuclease
VTFAPKILARLLFLFGAVVSVALADVGKVVGVHDGDTLTILTDAKESVKVRLFGIDAPETGQAFGSNSKEALSDLVFGKRVEFAGEQKDRYGRTVSKVAIPGGKDAGFEMISLGMAWHYVAYAKKEKGYADAEKKARGAGLGLWADREPVAPWIWRKTEKKR